jgi:hypothetical protein
MDEVDRLDLVWPFHFEELTDSDAYAYCAQESHVLHLVIQIVNETCSNMSVGVWE